MLFYWTHIRTELNHVFVYWIPLQVLNYGRFYGAGRPFIELLLKQFNPNLTGKEVEDKARTLLRATKGRRL